MRTDLQQTDFDNIPVVGVQVDSPADYMDSYRNLAT